MIVIKSEANGLLRKVCAFEFILCLTVLLDLLTYTKGLSDYLQRDDMDFVSAIQMQESLLTVLKSKRSENSFDVYYTKAQEKSQTLGFDNQEVPTPKSRISQRLDDRPETHHHHMSGKRKYLIDFYYGTIDLMINSLQRRFNTETITLLKGFSSLHPSPLNESEGLCKMEDLLHFYENDVAAVALRAEFDVFRHHQEIRNYTSISEILQLLYQRSLNVTYPNVMILYKLCMTLPVITCSVEHSFSKLKIVKNSLRSTMAESRLSLLLVLSIEHEITDFLDLKRLLIVLPRQNLDNYDYNPFIMLINLLINSNNYWPHPLCHRPFLAKFFGAFCTPKCHTCLASLPTPLGMKLGIWMT
uniref:HAT C-terminal dimerisation domain-containing protein n=1 Tax=Amphimedon queenslandica TaxID=400682 RepID=A0A1X7V7L6_AMPQE